MIAKKTALATLLFIISHSFSIGQNDLGSIDGQLFVQLISAPSTNFNWDSDSGLGAISGHVSSYQI
jgi:hypothetical protein